MFKSKKIYLVPILGFALIIIIGTALLCIPACNFNNVSFEDILFTATSGLTTTGFTKAPIISQYTFWGQVVLAFLMEIGAMGFIVFISYIWSIKDKKIRMSDLVFISESLSADNYSDIKKHTMFIAKWMFKIQAAGIILLAIKFIPTLGLKRGIWYSIFHTISAFSNTGFDLFSGTSFTPFATDVYVQSVIIGLMVIGSMGILVIEDLKNNQYKKLKKLKLQTKIILTFSIGLLAIPTILMKYYDPQMSFLNSLFMAASTRSTGFYVTEVAKLSMENKVILVILMFIGGSPESTSGGVKMITIAIILATIISTLEGKKDTVMFWRKIPDDIIKRAFTILFVFLLILFVIDSIFLHFGNIELGEIVFDSVSAISNTGLSVINYADLNMAGQVLIMLLMFIGRVGPMAMVLTFVREKKKDTNIEYPSENIIL